MKEIKVGNRNVPVVEHNDFVCPFCGSDNTHKIGAKDKALQSFMILNTPMTTLGAAAFLSNRKFLNKNNIDAIECNRCSERYFMKRKEFKENKTKEKVDMPRIRRVRNILLIAFIIYAFVFIGLGLLTNI